MYIKAVMVYYNSFILPTTLTFNVTSQSLPNAPNNRTACMYTRIYIQLHANHTVNEDTIQTRDYQVVVFDGGERL